MTLPDEFWTWVNDHLGDDPTRLRLAKRADSPEWLDLAITQVATRAKALKKLPKLMAEGPLVIPTPLAVEQSTSEPLAHFHSLIVKELNAKRVLDLTAGLGVDALTLARNGLDVTAVELDPLKANALEVNSKRLHLPLKVINDDCRNVAGQFDLAFIDPARRGAAGQRLFSLAHCEPDVTAMLPQLREITRWLVVKMSPMLDCNVVIDQLHPAWLIALGTTRECKELVAVVDLQNPSTETKISAVTINDRGRIINETPKDTIAPKIITNQPIPGDYLYLPYPAVTKIGAWGTLTHSFPCAQLAPDTHVYVSSGEIPSFPGQMYRIESVTPLGSKEIKAIAKQRLHATLITRNAGIPTDTLRQRLRLTDGPDTTLLVTRTPTARRRHAHPPPAPPPQTPDGGPPPGAPAGRGGGEVGARG
ncbi:MAG: class I SAM-dependent methyltransferase, partial [Bacteroidales bacterium]|nr:class I SAM-dependent methyltransferase [Bacteroidales bacterium]